MPCPTLEEAEAKKIVALLSIQLFYRIAAAALVLLFNWTGRS
jgi:hypothetical protein